MQVYKFVYKWERMQVFKYASIELGDAVMQISSVSFDSMQVCDPADIVFLIS